MAGCRCRSWAGSPTGPVCVSITGMTDRPPFTSDDEWRCIQARADVPVPDGPQVIACVVLRSPEVWREPELRVFVGDDGEAEEDQAEQAAWDHWEKTGMTSHVEVTWSWLAVGDERTVTTSCGSPGFLEQRAGFRFTAANRDRWINR